MKTTDHVKAMNYLKNEVCFFSGVDDVLIDETGMCVTFDMGGSITVDLVDGKLVYDLNFED